MAFTADVTYGREPIFTGTQGQIQEPFDTRAAAQDYADRVRTGEADVFLGRSWDQITISQNRNPDGTFARGFTVRVDYRRPGPGDNSDAVPPDQGEPEGAE